MNGLKLYSERIEWDGWNGPDKSFIVKDVCWLPQILEVFFF